MPSKLRFAPLKPSHAKQISRLHRQLYSVDQMKPAAEIQQVLLNADAPFLCNFSIGLFDDKTLVGYTIAYIESESYYHQREEEIFYWHEIMLKPGHERYLQRFLDKVVRQWRTYAPELALEAHAKTMERNKWLSLMRWFEKHGFFVEHRPEAESGENANWHSLRWEAQPPPIKPCRPLRIPQWRAQNGVSVALVSDPQKWQSLSPVWDTLLRQSPRHSACQSMDFLQAWWEHFGLTSELQIFVFYRDEEVIGIAPMMLEHCLILGKYLRRLSLLATTENLGSVRTILGGKSSLCIPALSEYLGAHADNWDFTALPEVNPVDVEAMLAGPGYQFSHTIKRSQVRSSAIDLQGTNDKSGTDLRAKTRRKINRLRRNPGIPANITFNRIDTSELLKAALEKHAEIEAGKGRSYGHQALWSNKSVYYFYRKIADIYGDDANFQIRQLTIGDQVLASSFGLIFDDVFHSLSIAVSSKRHSAALKSLLEAYELQDLLQQTRISRYEINRRGGDADLLWPYTEDRIETCHIYQKQWRLAVHYRIETLLSPYTQGLLENMGLFETVERCALLMRKVKPAAQRLALKFSLLGLSLKSAQQSQN